MLIYLFIYIWGKISDVVKVAIIHKEWLAKFGYKLKYERFS